MTKRLLTGLLVAALASLITAQDRIVIDLMGQGGKGAIAIPDLRGSGEAQRLMPSFNTTLWSEIEQSGLFRMVPKYRTRYRFHSNLKTGRLHSQRHGGESLHNR
ncbi:MAG: hypothetical protein WKF37_06500 [Bryobacteraceae bacterium]